MRAFLLLTLLAVGGCTSGIYQAPVRKPNYHSINADGSQSKKYSRINQWSSYGTSGLGMQSRIAAAYEKAQHAPAPALEVEIYNASLPPGVSLEHGTVKIDEDSPYTAIGRFEIGYWQDTAPEESEVEEDLRRLAFITKADAVILEVQRVGHADARVLYMNGIVFRKRELEAALDPVTPPRRAQARLDYQAQGQGCLSPEEFADEVSAKLGYSPWQPDATTTLHAQIRCNKGEHNATLSMPGAESRQLHGATCKALTEKLVTVLVVQLEKATYR